MVISVSQFINMKFRQLSYYLSRLVSIAEHKQNMEWPPPFPRVPTDRLENTDNIQTIYTCTDNVVRVYIGKSIPLLDFIVFFIYSIFIIISVQNLDRYKTDTSTVSGSRGWVSGDSCCILRVPKSHLSAKKSFFFLLIQSFVKP